MSIYCVGYDLMEKKDYLKLIEKLKSYDAYAHIQGSLWFVKSSKNASELRDELKSFIDEDDKLIVIRVTLPWASSNLSKGVSDWLKKVDF